MAGADVLEISPAQVEKLKLPECTKREEGRQVEQNVCSSYPATVFLNSKAAATARPAPPTKEGAQQWLALTAVSSSLSTLALVSQVSKEEWPNSLPLSEWSILPFLVNGFGFFVCLTPHGPGYLCCCIPSQIFVITCPHTLPKSVKIKRSLSAHKPRGQMTKKAKHTKCQATGPFVTMGWASPFLGSPTFLMVPFLAWRDRAVAAICFSSFQFDSNISPLA